MFIFVFNLVKVCFVIDDMLFLLSWRIVRVLSFLSKFVDMVMILLLVSVSFLSEVKLENVFF